MPNPIEPGSGSAFNKDYLSTKNWKPRFQRAILAALIYLGAMGATLDSEGWSYILMPTVLVGLLLQIATALLSGSSK